jgi:hypothetical protein
VAREAGEKDEEIRENCATGDVGVGRWGTYLGGEKAWMGIGASEGGGFVCSFRKHNPTLLAEIIQ